MPPEPEEDRYAVGRTMLGKSIRASRKSRGLTQRQLSDIAQLSINTIISLELGRVLPSLQSLDVVARALGTDARTLLKDVYPWDGEAPRG